MVVPGRMVFGWTSLTWGGGVSFLDTDAEGTAYGRAYLLTDQQFADVAAQEMHAEPGTDLELVHVLANRRHTFGPGRYETLCLLGELDGLPLLTFTADDVHALETNAPTASYLATLARGLRETHGLSVEATVDHLLTRPGIGDWTGEGLRSVVG